MSISFLNDKEIEKTMQEYQNSRDEIDLRKIFSSLWQSKYFIIIFTIISIILSSLYLRNLEPKYEVSVLLKPVQEENKPNLMGIGFASFAGIPITTQSAGDYNQYVVMLKTKEIARIIFKKEKLIRKLFLREWDEKQKIFTRKEPGRRTLAIRYIKELLTGQVSRGYEAPNPARLKVLIKKTFQISLDKKTNYITIKAEDRHPKLVTKLLLSMIDETDRLFKQKFLQQADDTLQFYQNKLAKTRSQEHRQILATLIAKEERKILLATRDAPFVAEIITGPNTSINPTSPKPKIILLLGFVLGLFLSCGIIIVKNSLPNSEND